MTENELSSIGYSDSIIFRPAALAGTNRPEGRLVEHVALYVYQTPLVMSDSNAERLPVLCRVSRLHSKSRFVFLRLAPLKLFMMWRAGRDTGKEHGYRRMVRFRATARRSKGAESGERTFYLYSYKQLWCFGFG